jgi:hypothetical protein
MSWQLELQPEVTRGGANRQRDELRGQEKHITSTKKNQEGTLRRYVL